MLKKEPAKPIDIVFLPYNRLEVKTSFTWDNASLNSKVTLFVKPTNFNIQLSAIWAKLQHLSKIQEERIYYYGQLANSESLFLHFDRKKNLVYQNGPIPAEYR